MNALSVVAALAVMAVVKVGGAAAFLALVRGRYEAPPRSVLFAALLRAGLGVVGTALIAGATFVAGLLANAMGGGLDAWWIGVPFAIAIQAVFRLAAWMGTLTFAFDPERKTLGRDAGFAVGGVLVSYLLDVPVAMLALADLFYLLRDTRFC